MNRGGSAHVTFTMRNYSLTHPLRFVLRFDSSPSSADTPMSVLYSQMKFGLLTKLMFRNLLQPRYTGPLTIRKMLLPSKSSTVQACFWISRPGMFAVPGWKVEVEVGEPWEDGSQTSWRTRHHYVHRPPVDSYPFFTVNPLSKTSGCVTK